jgi:hypothetical protein
MKEFTEFRTELNEGIEDLVEHVTMPPNILILRRKTVRQFPDGVMVALYYNDKLGLQFSIPYGPTQNPVVTPVGLEEKTAPMGIPDYKAPMGIDKNKAPMGIPTRTKWHYGKQPQVLDLQNLDEISIPAANRAYNERQRRGEEALKKSDYKTATGHFTKAVKTVHLRAKKHATVDAGGVVKEDDEYLSHSTSRGGRAAQKSSWMANFEKHVVKTNPAHSGKIDWNDAHHHHKQGTSPESAAKKYTDSNPTPHESHFHRESEELNEGAADDKRQEQQKTLWAKRQKRWGDWKSKQAKIQADMKTAGSKRDYDDHYMEEAAEHGVIQRLRNIKDFHAIKHITHADGTTTRVDPTTAHALLTVHDALHPDNQKKFADHLGHSGIKFNRMVDFAWKSVK